MVGSAGATRVMFSEAISEPSIRPANTAITPRSTPVLAAAPAALEATAVTGTRLPGSRQSEHPFGKEVAQHFRGSGLDRVRTRAEELVLPTVAVAYLRRRPGDVDRGLGHALVELGPHELQDRSLRAGDAVALDRCHGAISVQLQRASLDGVLSDLLADKWIRAAADLASVLGKL